MSTKTSNFGLIKPDLTDSADITAMNENWDKIDEQLKKAGESGGTDLVETELASTIYGDSPELDPVVQNAIDSLTASDVGAVSKEQLNTRLNTSIKEKALTLEPGFHSFHLGGGSYTGNDLPHSSYSYGTAEVIIRNKGGQGTIILWGKELAKVPVWCHFTDAVFTEWSTMFLPLSGGTLSGKILLPSLDLINSAVENIGRQAISSAGAYAFINVHPDGNTQLTLEKATYTLAQIFRLVVSGTTYTLHGTHNKPNGTYNGNGSATKRTINTGGIGNVCFIWGYGYSGFVTPVGVFAISVTSNGYYYDTDTTFADGVLTIASTSNYVNKSGTTYNYQVA